MNRNLFILGLAALVIGLPFLFRRESTVSSWRPGDPELVVIAAHNEAIRYEFGRAFSAWHEAEYGKPVRVDWRVIGGTSEIMRYLESEFTAAFRGYWKGLGHEWSGDISRAITDRRFDPDAPPPDAPGWDQVVAAYRAFRTTDDAEAFSSEIDVFFGGGEYDHSKAGRQGLAVAPWPPEDPPPGLYFTAAGDLLIPEVLSGERWRGATFIGTAISTFGICYNLDRLNDLGIPVPPVHWDDLADPAYFRQLGLADPTKSGSISKAFEMIIHQKMFDRVRAEGFSEEAIAVLESGSDTGGVEASGYGDALHRGWREGIELVQLLGANARYFTDSASKVPIDVSTGDAAAGLAIDFYGRYQAETSRGPGGEVRMEYVTPVGGSSVSADPISLLRGARNRELAVRFIRFVLDEPGQRLWNYRVGAPGGPEKFALRRLPIRADFYPEGPDDGARFEEHAPYFVDPLGDPSVNPYRLAARFTYHGRWTGRHFAIHRDLIRAMCLDAGDELRAAWAAILEHGGPEVNPEAMRLLRRLPDRPFALDWESILRVPMEQQRLDYMREWTNFFRASYAEARRAAESGGHSG